MTPFRRLTVGILIGAVVGAVHVFAGAQAATRTIRYDRNTPIASQLLPSDSRVFVTKVVMPPEVGTRGTGTFEVEVQHLAQYQKIALVEMSQPQGELIDGGTWVQTRFRGHPIQIVKWTEPGSAGDLEFAHDGGAITIGSVLVSAGLYPQFAAGERYLLFLVTDRATSALFPGLAFHVDAQGKLEAVKFSDGTSIAADSRLIGRPLSELITALSR